ncbi:MULTISPECIES: ROK family protein [unclassified Lentimonas]|uniref:ROK family protein n=1 Tax=unclassified Lentimonas TaxID=2630993 RepID=UPI0013289E37|nr:MULTISPECIES: ROK family protein [unclassified Lentimonas]CAA6679318.1 Glucokinase (EC [Lentimonas sp. CC4]CAA6686355.1 Glucokinase (EC [Lentimonas sp. CC6]CAA7076129.1 Glucokinase (EC [Lentimonas sp. CC4]CAA7170878.1 Glucokinase (EC [Lentimonas sp. CC21]CAA7181180.1 Glucokinase (EC [Lentimonas sp. CC8]
MKFTIGTDIGGTNTTTGIVDPSGKIIRSHSFRTDDYDDSQQYAAQLAESVTSLIQQTEAELGGADVEWLGMGIGAPNGNSLRNSIDHAPNLRFKGEILLADMLNQHLKLPTIRLANDANAAAIGEKIYGGAADYDHFIMITLGTGLGSGIYVDGKLVDGQHGMAGEVGHMSVIPNGRYCNYHRRGSLENYCSAMGIRRTFFEMLAETGQASKLNHLPIDDIDSKLIAKCASEGDAICKDTMEFTGRLLGEALASVALVTNPAAIFLFGGPVQAGDILLSPTRRSFEKHIIPTYQNKIKILTSELPLGEAALLGAAALVLTNK